MGFSDANEENSKNQFSNWGYKNRLWSQFPHRHDKHNLNVVNGKFQIRTTNTEWQMGKRDPESFEGYLMFQFAYNWTSKGFRENRFKSVLRILCNEPES